VSTLFTQRRHAGLNDGYLRAMFKFPAMKNGQAAPRQRAKYIAKFIPEGCDQNQLKMSPATRTMFSLSLD